MSTKMNRKPAKAPSPEQIQAALTQAQVLAANQRLEEAERLLARYPDVAECVFRRAALLVTLERWAEAEQGFRQILAVAPKHFDSAVALAGTLLEQDRPAEALPLFDAAIRAQPNQSRLHYFRGIAAEEAGRPEDGAASLAHARDMLIKQIEARELRPLEVYLQISRRCNLRCAMCGHEVWQSNAGFMEQEVFDRALAQAKECGVKAIHILSGQGEPLLHPKVFEMLEQAVAEGFEVGIVTNGTPLNPERAKRFAGIGLKYIQFSFAGWDKESYEATYVGSKFERTLENLKLMTELTRGTKTNFMVKAVCSGENWTEVRTRTREFLAAQGVERVFTVMANNFGGHVTHGQYFEQHDVWSLRNLTHQRRMPCRVFLKAVGVFCDGTVTACACYDSNAELKIGHIMEQDLADIRRGEDFRRTLEAFRKGDLTGVPMCAKCDDPFG